MGGILPLHQEGRPPVLYDNMMVGIAALNIDAEQTKEQVAKGKAAAHKAQNLKGGMCSVIVCLNRDGGETVKNYAVGEVPSSGGRYHGLNSWVGIVQIADGVRFQTGSGVLRPETGFFMCLAQSGPKNCYPRTQKEDKIKAAIAKDFGKSGFAKMVKAAIERGSILAHVVLPRFKGDDKAVETTWQKCDAWAPKMAALNSMDVTSFHKGDFSGTWQDYCDAWYNNDDHAKWVQTYGQTGTRTRASATDFSDDEC